MNFSNKMNIDPAKIINHDTLKAHRGGAELEEYFYCACGFEPEHGPVFPVMASDIVEALSVADSVCGEPGNTCKGEPF